LGLVIQACNSSYLGDGGRRITRLRQSQAKSAKTKQDKTKQRAVVIAQVVECLPRMYKPSV
jgi:hypothetical protein